MVASCCYQMPSMRVVILVICFVVVTHSFRMHDPIKARIVSKPQFLLNDRDRFVETVMSTGPEDLFRFIEKNSNELLNADVLEEFFKKYSSQLKILLDQYGPDVWKSLEAAAANEATIPIVTLTVFLMVVGGFGQDDSNVGSPYPAGSTSYDIKSADMFYSSRPLFVLRRLLRLANLTGAFNLKLLLDWRFGKIEKNQAERAKEALVLATQLGPTFIKLGQALSIRTDLIPEAYALELRQLQDAVPPFDSSIAKEVIRQEIGVKDLRESFQKISDVPVASASIGQVYRATLKDGRDVAVKVQRPNILGEIALDLYLLRLLTPLQVTASNAINKRKTDQNDIDVAIALVDEWGRGFVAEVDYRLEAENTKQFQAAMVDRGLDAVTAPTVVDELSGSRVIVTEWMDGTRLDRDASPDVPRLCGVAINAYLTMLLDTGVLHCDPHPGNLLRTLDGRLCILDWGMTLRVPRDLQYSLLEFIAHINTENYAALPADFINLGFSPPGKLAQLEKSGLTESLSFAFRQLSKGGGPSKIRDRVKDEFKARYGADLSDEELRARAREEMISRMQKQLQDEGVNVNGVTGVMEEMSRRNRELFKLPPYVLYVSRAFSTLEGIGLSVNPEYSIVQECYPYLARRLMTDDSPRAKNALRAMLQGSGNIISVDKFVEMSDGFSSYTAFTASADRDGAGSRKAQLALTELVLQEEGNYVQDILLESAAKTTDALVREGYAVAKNSPAGQTLKSVLKFQKQFVDSVIPSPLRPFAGPLLLPYHVAKAVDMIAAKSPEDASSIEALTSIQKLVQLRLAETSGSGSHLDKDNKAVGASPALSLTSIAERVQKEIADPDSRLLEVVRDPAIRDRLPGAALNLSRRFGTALLHRAADRLDAVNEHAAGQAAAVSARGGGAGAGAGGDALAGVGAGPADELLLAQRLSEISSSTAKSLAKAIAP